MSLVCVDTDHLEERFCFGKRALSGKFGFKPIKSRRMGIRGLEKNPGTDRSCVQPWPGFRGELNPTGEFLSMVCVSTYMIGEEATSPCARRSRLRAPEAAVRSLLRPPNRGGGRDVTGFYGGMALSADMLRYRLNLVEDQAI